MKKRNLTFRFHDPNPPGAAAEHILKVFLEVNAPKVEQAIRAAMAAGDPEQPAEQEAVERDEAAQISNKAGEEEETASHGREMTMAM